MTDALVKGRAFRDDEDLFELLDDFEGTLRDSHCRQRRQTRELLTTYDTIECFRRHSEDMMGEADGRLALQKLHCVAARLLHTGYVRI